MKSIILAFMILICLSCGSKQDSVLEIAMADQMYELDQESVPEQTEVEIERKIIREGEINFETSNTSKTREVIASIVAKSSGYISDDNVNDYDNGKHYSMTIHMPAEKFDTVLSAICATAKKLNSKNIHTMDVTEEFIDVQARVKIKKELEGRYKELLKRAGTVNDILSIERELGTLRAEIESIEGRLQYLTNRTSFSTLTVLFYEQGESSYGFGSKLTNAIKGGWDNLLRFLIGLIHLWPFILLVPAGIFLFRKFRKKRKNKTEK